MGLNGRFGKSSDEHKQIFRNLERLMIYRCRIGVIVRLAMAEAPQNLPRHSLHPQAHDADVRLLYVAARLWLRQQCLQLLQEQ